MRSISTLVVKAKDQPIKSVTIFKSSKAEIVRTFSLKLKGGQNKVEVSGLPSTIDSHSVRVSGLGDARLSDVVCTTTADKESSYSPENPSEIIRLLRVKKETLESELQIVEQESELIMNYAKTLNGEHNPPTDMWQFLKNFGDAAYQKIKAVNELREKILVIERQIEQQDEKASLKSGNSHGKITIVLGADEDTTVDLKLTYIVSGVHWSPTYELHATTENGKPSPSVSLHYRALVRQSTGEDWTNTSLTLSTVTSDNVKRIPVLHPVKLKEARPFFSPTNNQPVREGGLFGQPQQQQIFPRQQQQIIPRQQQQIIPRQQQPMGSPQQQQIGQPQQQSIFGQARPAFAQTRQGLAQGGLFGSVPPPQPPTVIPANCTVPFGSGDSFTSSGPAPLAGGYNTFDTASSSFGSGFGSSSVVPTTAETTTVEEENFEEVLPAVITVPSSFVAETPIAISYSIKGESTIPSDGVEHQVSVAILPFEAVISYLAVPRIDPRVYLQCSVKNSSDYRLLFGPVSVILDDSYVSKSNIFDVNMGDTFECTLGDDPATKVIYSRNSCITKNEGGAFAEVTNTTTYTTTITIYNKHAFVLPDLVVRDIIPTCDDKRGKVVLRKPDGLANAKDGQGVAVGKEADGVKIMWEKLVDGKGGEKEGKFQWKGSIKAKDKLVLVAEWEVKGPADVQWIETVSSTTPFVFGPPQ